MSIIGNFSQVPLQGLILANGKTPKNPTSLQFGPDGRLYISLQNGTILAATIEKVGNAYQVVGAVEELTLVKDIPNHNDDGTLNLGEDKRQITGLVVEADADGNTVLYVSSSDPRIGAGNSGIDENLDTNSGILTRLTLKNANAPAGNNRWKKTDLVIGLPRSEENHATNGLDIRTEIVNGVARKIMYVAQGGHTNKGGPSSNFAFQSEYYYSGAMLRVDLTQLEAIEAATLNANGTLAGGTAYADNYVYALPTLNDPTRADVNGRDTAVGTTGPADAVAADTFGGNNGRNQAKYDADGPVQVYSTGYRNQYDVVITENNNIYTFDNGPNNGWGDVPITDGGVPVNLDDANPNNDVATNRPNTTVDTGSDKDNDSLHLVTEGFYAGLPNPTRASGSAAGLFVVSANGVVTELTANNGTPTLEDDLPVDWDEVSGGLANPIEGVYKAPGNSINGNTKGEDGSLVTIGTSSNGLTEYTASGISDSNNPNAEVLVVASFNGDLTFIEVESDGTQSGSNVVDTKAFNVGGTPLDVTAVGNQGVDGNGKFAGTVWTGLFGPDTILILEPSSGPVVVDTDQDDDGITDAKDHLQYDPDNGTKTMLNGGETLFWDFNPGEEGQHPGKGTAAEGVYNVGLTGWQTNGVDDLYLDPNDPNDDQLTNLDNTIRGGAPGIIQVKEVGSGDNDLLNNNQKDAIQTGFLPGNDVKDFTIIVPIFNPFSSDANNGVAWTSFGSVGISLGDGSQSNFVEIAVGAKGPNNLSLKVSYEENDVLIQSPELDNVEFLLKDSAGGQAIDGDQIELRLNVDMETFQLTPEWRYQLSGQWSAISQIGGAPIQLKSNGNIVKALQGNYINNGLKSAPVVSLLSSSRGPVGEFTADYLDLTIESTAKTVETADLSLTQQVSDSSPNIGDEITVSLTLNNSGPNGATGVSVKDLLPAGLSYLSDNSGGKYNAATGLWSVGSVASGGTTTLSIQAAVTEVTAGDALYRVNVGGAEIAATGGSTTVWEADTAADPSPYRTGSGGSRLRTVGAAIDVSSSTLPAGTPAGIFSSERVDRSPSPNMLWDFAVTPGSEVEVRLYFAELFNNVDTVGERFFDVSVEGTVPTVFNDIDPFAIAGGKRGFMLSDTVTVADGVLNLEFLKEKKQPSVTGIEIIDLSGGALSGASYTNYAQVLTANQVDSDSTPGDNSTNQDDDTTAVIRPNQGSVNLVAIASNTNAAEPNQNGQFTVSLATATATDTVIAYSVSGSATAGSDYTALSGSTTILAGERTATIDVDVLDDTVLEPNETVTVSLTGVTNGASGIAIGGNRSATVTIADNEVASSSADLSLTQTVSDSTPDIGDTVTFTLTVNNSGPDGASGVSVADLLPSGFSYVGDNSGGAYNATNGRWTVGTVASGASATLNIRATVTEVIGGGGGGGGGEALYRINVGGAEVADGNNLAWAADTAANPSSNRIGAGGGKARTLKATIDASSATLPAGTPAEIFQSVRSDPSAAPNMLWDFAVTPGSEVEVRLYFAELFNNINTVGERLFDVAVEGAVPTAFNDIDPFAIAGSKSGFMLSDTVTVSDGVLNLEFLHDTQRPVVTGIEIVDVSGSGSGGGGALSTNAYKNYAQILSANQADPDSTPGDNSIGDDDDATVTVRPNDPVSGSGSAVLSITENSNNVKISNFGNNSFLLTNTGDKKIAQVDIDVTEALYPDAVFDPFGLAGDTASKGLTIDTNGNTGVVAPSNASYVGVGGTAGFEGLKIVFDQAVSGGFDPGETLGFSIDMDPNSVTGGNKVQLNRGSSPRWDVGGISGAELIGSSFTVTFTDGSTATGQLHGADNQAGSKGLAAQDSPNTSVALTVNGLGAGGIGTYDASGPSVIVNGPAGETARVILTKGFIQPVTPYAPFIETQLDALVTEDFPANQAVEFQTVDIVLTGSPQNISNQFDFSGVPKFNFANEDQLPLGFVASVIDPANDDLPLGPVTQPIYLQFAEPLRLAGSPTQGGDILTASELAPVVEAAIDFWTQQGASDAAIDMLETVDVLIGDLGGATLGEADGLVITLDDDAAGYGWSTSLSADFEGDAVAQVDLLSAIAHEFGHVLGLGHSVLGETLGVGERQLPTDFVAEQLSEVAQLNLSLV